MSAWRVPLTDVVVGEQEMEVPGPKSDRSWTASFHRVRSEWRSGRRPEEGLRKRHGLQGPIDDAFMDKFIFVRPTGQAWHEQPGKWAAAEMERAIVHWRRHFRGVARVKDDTAITPEDIAGSNLVLWGDPNSNAVLKQIAEKLPASWTREVITVGDRKVTLVDYSLANWAEDEGPFPFGVYAIAQDQGEPLDQHHALDREGREAERTGARSSSFSLNTFGEVLPFALT